jgi:dephospho-CoA kinase
VLVRRLAAGRGWGESDARARLAAQPSQKTFAAAADVVLENRGTEAELTAAARAAVGRLAARRAERSA